MIRILNGNSSKLIFDYLTEEQSALLSGITEIYLGSYLPDGVFAIEYQGNVPVSVIANGESFSLLFISENSALCELYFSLKKTVHSPCRLYAEKTGEYYLLKKSVAVRMSEAEPQYEDFKSILTLNSAEETVNLQYLFKKGNLLPYQVREIGGGFIINSANYSVISHVFVKEEMRNNGHGTEIVKKLLNMSVNENVYLISEKDNLDFYKKLGFTPVLTVYKYQR